MAAQGKIVQPVRLNDGSVQEFEFPAGTPRETQERAIRKYLGEQPDATIQQRADAGVPVNIGEVSREGQAAQRQQATDERGGILSTVSDVAVGALDLADRGIEYVAPEFYEGLKESGANPMNYPKAVKAMLDAGVTGTAGALLQYQAQPWNETYARIDPSDPESYLNAGVGFIKSITPILGPMTHDVSEMWHKEGLPKALGFATGELATAAVPGAAWLRNPIRMTRNIASKARVPGLGPSRRLRDNPDLQRANQWAMEEGIPLTAAEHTGGRGIRAIQDQGEYGWGGQNIAADFRARQAQAQERTMGRLAQEAEQNLDTTGRSRVIDTDRQTPVGAAEQFQTRTTALVERHKRDADRFYDSVRAKEAVDPDRYTVDITDLKDDLLKIYADADWKDLSPDQRSANQALTIIENVVEGADTMRLSDLDHLQSQLGQMTFGQLRGDIPVRLKGGARLLRKVFNDTRRKVDRAATNLGVMDDIKAGRTATRQSYEVEAILKKVFGPDGAKEPFAAYKILTTRGDGRIKLLRAINAKDPGLLRHTARGFIDDLLEQATERKGSFSSGQKIAGEWFKLGAETKRILFPDADHRQSLDNFFRTADNIAWQANPSGTRTSQRATISATNALALAPTWVIAKAMLTERGARWLTRGASMRVKPSNLNTDEAIRRSAPAQWVAQGLRLATEGRTTALAPGVAETDQEADPQEIDQEQGTR